MAKFEITQVQLCQSVIGMAHYVEHLKNTVATGRPVDVVLAKHDLAKAQPAFDELQALFATTSESLAA